MRVLSVEQACQGESSGVGKRGDAGCIQLEERVEQQGAGSGEPVRGEGRRGVDQFGEESIDLRDGGREGLEKKGFELLVNVCYGEDQLQDSLQ